MPLSVQNRRVGDIAVVTCAGEIVEGAETAVLRRELDALFANGPYVVLNLSAVPFIDSSGLGVLVRYLMRSQALGGSLALCAITHRIREVLRISRLQDVLASYDTEGDAIAACYQSGRAADRQDRLSTDVLCVDLSSDVQSFVREVLGQAGHGALTTGNLPDALILLRATQPKVVVVGAALRSSRNTATAETFNRLVDERPCVELPEGFSGADAGDAAKQLLDHVERVLGVNRS